MIVYMLGLLVKSGCDAAQRYELLIDPAADAFVSNFA